MQFRHTGNFLKSALLIITAIVCLLLVAHISSQHAQAEEKANKVVDGKKIVQKAEDKKDDKKDDKKKAAPKKAPANPVADMIKGIFGGRPAPPKARPEMNRPGNKLELKKKVIDLTKPQDSVDERAPLLRSHAAYLKSIRAKLKNEQWALALDAFQSLLEEKNDSFFRDKEGNLKSIRWEVHSLIKQLPPNIFDNYKRQNEPIANQLLEEANESHSMEAYATIANRFFHTPSGHKAADRLSKLHFDRGEFGLCSLWNQRLQNAEAKLTENPVWIFRASIAKQRAGQSIERLSLQGISKDVVLGSTGTQNPLSKWSSKLPQLASNSQGRTENWTQLYGSPSRTAIASHGTPLLVTKWFRSTTSRFKLKQIINRLIDDLKLVSKLPIPASFAVSIDNKVAFRTLYGISLVDVPTGKTLWEFQEKYSPEFLMSRNLALNSNYANTSNNVDFNPLTSFFFRNGIHGTLSCDKQQLYAITNNAVLNQKRTSYYSSNLTADELNRDWKSNRITSIRLSDGKVAWAVGGQKLDEPFDLPLAGTFFFGAPVVHENLLYATGENSNEIVLFCLDPKDGQVLWSQVLAYSDREIDDFLTPERRLTPLLPSISQGVIVCPTGIGWAMGVDLSSHQILWAYRQSKQKINAPKTRRNVYGGSPQVFQLNQRWTTSSPIISGNRVIYAPQELLTGETNPVVVCLDLQSGKELWKRFKNDYISIIGVNNEKLLIATRKSLIAIDIVKNEDLWTQEFDEKDDALSGQGLLMGNKCLIPFESGKLWSVDISDKPIVTTYYRSENSKPLRNLVASQKSLLSLSPLGLTAFEQKEEITKVIENRIAKNPKDSWAGLKQAEIAYLSKDYQVTLEKLSALDQTKIEKSETGRFDLMMWTSLLQIIQSDLKSHDEKFIQLKEFAKTDEQQQRYQIVKADRLSARGDFENALRIYLSLSEKENQHFVQLISNPLVKQAHSLFLKKQMSSIWLASQKENDDKVESLINERIETLIDSNDIQQLMQASLVFDFHPKSSQINKQIAELAITNGDLGIAETYLFKVIRNGNEKDIIAASVLLASELEKFELYEDAMETLIPLADSYPNSKLESGTVLATFVGDKVEQLKKLTKPEFDKSLWNQSKFETSRSTGYFYNSQNANLKVAMTGAADSPFHNNSKLLYDRNIRWLKVHDRQTGEQTWSFPLHSNTAFDRTYQIVGSRMKGRRFAIVHQGWLSVISPAESKILWQKQLNLRNAREAVNYAPQRQSRSQLSKVSSTRRLTAVANKAKAGGLIALATSDVIIYYGRKKLIAVEASTGRNLWTRSGITSGSYVFGDEQVTYLIPINTSQSIAIDTQTGEELSLQGSKSWVSRLPNAISYRGRKILLIDHSNDKHSIVFLFDPLTDKVIWQKPVNKTSYMGYTGKNDLVTINDENNRVDAINLDNGKSRKLGVLPSNRLKSQRSFDLASDEENIYLFANSSRRPSESYGFYRIYMNGLVYAFNKSQKKLAWSRKVSTKHIDLRSIDLMPTLLFTKSLYQRKNNPYYFELGVMMLNKETGKTLIDHNFRTRNATITSMTTNLAKGLIQLGTSSERFKFFIKKPKEAPITDNTEAPEKEAIEFDF